MRTNLKKRPLLFGVFYVAFFGIASSNGFALTVANGDFSDTNGLTAQGGGWYQGVPAGWTSTAVDPTYAVLDGAIGNSPPVANLGQLPVLRQNVGTTTSAGQVTVRFDLGTFGGTPNVTVRLTDGASVVYASGSYTTGSNRALSANIAGDRPVYIEFENTPGVNPWLDNVSVTTFAPSVVNGNFADTTGLTDMGGGWFAGLPAGWSTTESTPDAYAYSVRQIGTTSYANLDILGSNRDGFSPLRQSIGALEVASDIKVSFKATSLNGFPYIVGTAIYNAADDSALATYTTPLVNGNTTVTYSALAIPAGTEVYVAFWTSGSLAPGITDVVIGVTGAATTLSMESASSVELDATSPVACAGNIVFQPGAKVSVTGNPAGSAVVLLSAGGSISGTPALDPSVAGYTLGNTGKLLWLRPNGTSSLAAFNGDFSNLSGLTPAGETWYSGVPLGWTYANPANQTAYSVRNTTPGNWAANLSVLGVAYSGFYPLTQLVGTTQATGDVTLSFDVVKPANTNRVAVGAALYNAADGSTLANIAIDSNTGPDSGLFSLTAVGVAAGTPIQIAFWSSLDPANAESFQSYPFLDNVALSVTYANRAPMDISLSGSSIAENNLVGDVVGTLSAIDPDADDTHSFSLVSGDGDTDNASFEIEGSTLKANVVFDHETQASYSIRVRSTDAGSLFTEKTFTITVIDVAEQTPQQAYLASFGLSGDDLLGTADPDGDSMDNDAEFAFGTSPVSGASRAATLSTGTGTIKLTYLQRNSGVTYTVKSLPSLTTDFDSGTDVGPVASEPQPSGIPGGYTQYEASISTGSARGFLRVRAVAD